MGFWKKKTKGCKQSNKKDSTTCNTAVKEEKDKIYDLSELNDRLKQSIKKEEGKRQRRRLERLKKEKEMLYEKEQKQLNNLKKEIRDLVTSFTKKIINNDISSRSFTLKLNIIEATCKKYKQDVYQYILNYPNFDFQITRNSLIIKLKPRARSSVLTVFGKSIGDIEIHYEKNEQSDEDEDEYSYEYTYYE